MAWSSMLVLLATVAIPVLFASAIPPDITLKISSDLTNSAARVYTEAGLLSYKSIIPGVDTSDLKDVINPAFDLCPYCPMSAEIEATASPLVNISDKEGAHLFIRNSIVSFAAVNETEELPLFDIFLNGSIGLTFSNDFTRSGDTLKTNATLLCVSLVVRNSSVGPTPAALIPVLNPLVNAYLENTVIPEFNDQDPGLPIPNVPGMNFSGAAILLTDGNITMRFYLESDSVSSLLSRRQERGEEDEQAIVLHSSDTRRESYSDQPKRSRSSDRGWRRHRGEEPMPDPLDDVTPPKNKYQAQSVPPGFSGPGAVLVVGQNGLNNILDFFLPQLEEQVNDITIPPMSGKADGLSYTINEAHVTDFTVGDAEFTFEHLFEPQLILSIDDITLRLPRTGFRVSKKILGIDLHCSGHFSGSLDATTVSMSLNFTSTKEGQPQLTTDADWSFGPLQVSVTMDHAQCEVISDVVQWFVGNIDDQLANELKQEIPSLVEELIETSGNDALADLSMTYQVDAAAVVSYALTQDPSINNSELALYLSGEFQPTVPPSSASSSA